MKNKSVLNSFNLLRQGSKNLQINSGIDVLYHLWTKQKNCGLEEPCNELQLCIERIVRGLGAPRSNSRKGFFLTFVGLCELFSSSTITIQMCFDAVKKELHDFASKGEENYVYKGQMLAYGGLIYSGKILQANNEETQHLLRQLHLISCKKSYLALAAHIFLVDWINQMDEKFFKESLWEIILSEILLKTEDGKTLQLFNLLFLMSKKFPLLVDENVLMRVIGSPSIFHKANSEVIGKVILTTFHTSTYIDIPVYEQMLSELINNNVIFKTIWSMIDENLTSASPALIEYIFKFFIYCFQKLNDKSKIKTIFKPNFVKMIGSKSDANSVEEVRLRTISEFSEIISKKGLLSSKTQRIVVKKLLFYPGSFDVLKQHQGVKIFQSLATGFDEVSVKSILKRFIDVLNGNSMRIANKTVNKGAIKKPWKDWQKRKACKIIITLLNHPTVITCIDWKVEQLKSIIDAAFFSRTVSSKLRQDARRSFYSVLDFRFVKLTDLCILLYGIVNYLDCKMNCDNYMSVEFSKQMQKAWAKMFSTVNVIASDSGHSDDRQLMNTVFHVMFLLLGLTLITDSNVGIDNLSELHAIHKRMCLEFENTNEINLRDEQKLHWTDVVVDLILSLLSYNSHFLRNVISSIFIFLCPHLSAQNIHQILTVLNPNEDSVLSSNIHNNMVVSNEENNGERESSDDDDSVLSNSSDDRSSESSQEDYLLDPNEDTDHDKLRARIREALGDAGAVTDTESIDLNNLDEEEGKRLDESLSVVFREMKEYKLKSQTAEHRQLSDFRIRVLDLLEVWVKTGPELNVIFDVMVTVLMLLENSLQNRTDVQLQTKLRSFVKQLTSAKQFTANGKLDTKRVVELMKKLMNKDEKTTSVYKNMSPQIIECCSFILKVSLRDLKYVKKMRPLIVKAYQSALHDFFHNTNSILPIGLFKSAFTLPWEGLFDLVEDILDYSLKPDIKLFHLSHALNFLQIFLRNHRLLTMEACKEYNCRISQIAQKLVNVVNILEGRPDKLCFQFIQICQNIKKLNVASAIIDTIDLDLLKKNRFNLKRKSKSELPLTSSTKKTKCVKNVDVNIDARIEENVHRQNPTQLVNKRKRDKYTNALKLKKKCKFVGSEELSKGIERSSFT